MSPRSRYCEVLGLRPDAEPEEIRQAFHAAALRYHPDNYRGDPDEGRKLFSRVVESYRYLSAWARRRGRDRRKALTPSELARWGYARSSGWSGPFGGFRSVWPSQRRPRMSAGETFRKLIGPAVFGVMCALTVGVVAVSYWDRAKALSGGLGALDAGACVLLSVGVYLSILTVATLVVATWRVAVRVYTALRLPAPSGHRLERSQAEAG